MQNDAARDDDTEAEDEMGSAGEVRVDDVRTTRRSERVDLGFEDGIWSEVKQSATDSAHAVIIALGAHGALLKILESNDQFAVGRSMSLRFPLPGTADHIRCGCVVRDHVSKYDIGVEFILIRPAHRERLTEAISYLRLVAAA